MTRLQKYQSTPIAFRKTNAIFQKFKSKVFNRCK